MYLFIPLFHLSLLREKQPLEISFSCLITDAHTNIQSLFYFHLHHPPPLSHFPYWATTSPSPAHSSWWVCESLKRRGLERQHRTPRLQWKLIIHGSERWWRNSANTQTIAISATPTKVTKPYTHLAGIVYKQRANTGVQMTEVRCKMKSCEFVSLYRKASRLLVFLVVLLSTHHT